MANKQNVQRLTKWRSTKRQVGEMTLYHLAANNWVHSFTFFKMKIYRCKFIASQYKKCRKMLVHTSKNLIKFY